MVASSVHIKKGLYSNHMNQSLKSYKFSSKFESIKNY